MLPDPTMSPEEWRPVPDLEGRYWVSSLGNVKGVRGTLLTKFRVHPGGRPHKAYHAVGIRKTKGGWVSHVAHLVAAAFIGPRPPGMYVNHIDLNTFNNAASNLEYVTPQGNNEHAAKNGRMKRSGLTEESVRIIKSLKGKRSQTALGREYGVSQVLIGLIHNEKLWKWVEPLESPL